MNTHFYWKLLLFVMLGNFNAFAQLATPIAPQSFRTEVSARTAIRTATLEALNLEKIQLEDAQTLNANRFAAKVSGRFDLKNVASTTKVDGGVVYRYKVELPGALGLYVIYEKFRLPQGATLHMYSPDRQEVLGAYTYRNNKKTGTFMTGEIRGEQFVLEYFEPEHVIGEVVIEGFYARYKKLKQRPLPGVQRGSGVYRFGDSDVCNVNINCEAADIFQTAKKSSVRIMMAIQNGIAMCSGTVMNNARQDKDPLVLSAFHCVDGFEPRYDLWRFDFNYEHPTCANSDTEPTFQSLIGAEPLAGYQASDFMLVRIAQAIPDSYGARYAGWDANEVPQIDSAFIIHHPQSDVKKISIYNDSPVIYNRGITWTNDVRTPPNHHFNGFFKKGTFEPGSSGAALYNHNGQVIGQLHGGNGSCSLLREIETFCGRLFVSFDGRTAEQQLKDFLDPDGLGILELASIDPVDQVFSLSGLIKNATEAPMDSVLIRRYIITATDTSLVDSLYSENGRFELSLSADENYWFTFGKEAEQTAGLSFSDLNIMQLLLLGKENLSNLSHLAGDINKDARVSVADLNLLQTALLGRDVQFPNTWLFYDPNTFTTSPPFFDAPVRGFGIQPTQDMSIEIVGIKSGDLNYSE